MTRGDVYRATLRHFFAPVADFLYDDPTVTEVLVNGPDDIHVERAGVLHATDRRFASAAALDAAVRNLAEYVHRRLDDRHHSMTARLPAPEQFRVHVVIPPAGRRVFVCLRKFRQADTTLDWFVRTESITPDAAAYLAAAVRAKRNVVVAGGTGTGKTTLLNALSAEIPAAERVVVVEDTSELRLGQPHTVYLETKPADLKGRGGVTVRDLFVDSLRMRPDRIVVGEVRGGEALDLIQSMLSGHDGALSTVHASSPRHALVRLETLCLLAEVAVPMAVARRQVAEAVHVVAHLVRRPDGPRRVAAVSEVAGLSRAGEYRLRTVFALDPATGRLAPTGRPARFR